MENKTTGVEPEVIETEDTVNGDEEVVSADDELSGADNSDSGERHHHHHHHHHHRRSRKKKKKTGLDNRVVLIISIVLFVILAAVVVTFEMVDVYKPGDSNEQTGEPDTPSGSTIANIALMKEWDTPIYDADIPVFELSSEKPAMTDAACTPSDIYAKYDALMAKHPDYITKTDLGLCSDGVNHVYRYDFREPEPYVDISGKHEWSETKSKAIIVSGIHWELGGVFSLYYALEEIAENPILKDFRRNIHLIVIPVSNPYGLEHQSVRNANQVEIHRNFEVDFIYPGKDGYIELGQRSHGGVSPLSEIETQYIDDVLKNNTDAAFFLSCHSFQKDTVWGTGFIWHSPSTYYMCNMGFRVIDKLSNAWMIKYSDVLSTGINEYKTYNLDDNDVCLGFGRVSTTNGTEAKQAMKYGIQGINLEICDTFWAHGTKENPEPVMSSFTMSRGAEVYVNFLKTAFGVYDPKDKPLYSGK